MFKALTVTAFLGIVALGVTPAHADPPTPASPAGQALGIVPPHNQGKVHNTTSGSNLIYHTGGSVQTGQQHTYAIFWGATSTFPDGNYQSDLTTYLSNAAAASAAHATNNVYDTETQYYQNIGSTTYIQYNQSFAGTAWDQTNPTSSGCSSTAGGTVACVTDAQIQSEVGKEIAAKGWPTGSSYEYFVFLGNGISTCDGTSCFVSQFCAYHSHYGSGSSTVLYANMPYTGYSLAACGSGQYPNNDPAADSTINVTSHEQNETITDELGNAWYDRRGYEIGDKCAWIFGSPTGPSGAEYNQTINGTHYYLQGEWSNKHSGCVWSGV